MAITTPVYATRETVKETLDILETARRNRLIDTKLQSNAETVEGTLNRRFYPEIATRNFDWPNFQYAPPWRLWLDSNELILVTTLTAGGTVISSDDYILRRSDDKNEPPFNFIDIDLSSSAAFSAGSTHQQAIEIVGLYGYDDNSADTGTATEALTDSATSLIVSDGGSIGVGSIIKIDSERMFVTEKALTDSTQNLGANLTAAKNDQTVTVADGTLFNVDEIILIDAERMVIVDIAGNNLIVRRASDGSTLAAHTATTDIYVARRLTLTRGVLGTTAAAHLDNAAISVHVPPSLVSEFNSALALNDLLQGLAGWARTSGSGENTREIAGLGLADLEKRVITRYGRKLRLGGI